MFELLFNQPLPVWRDAALVFSRKSGKPLGEPLSGFFTAKGYRQAFLLSSQRNN